jgi:hypothetical protein
MHASVLHAVWWILMQEMCMYMCHVLMCLYVGKAAIPIILETPFQLKERVKCDGSHGKKKQDHLSAEIKSSNIGAHTPRVVIP